MFFFSLSSYCIFKRNTYNRLLFYAGEKQHTPHHIASTEPFKHDECNTDACFQYFLAVSMANVSEAFSFSSLGSDNEPVTVKHFRCINHQVGAEKWRDVLRILSMEEVTIENVDAENSTVAEKFYQGLLTWMRSRGTQRATTKKLCEALRLAGCSEAFEKLSREGMSNNCEHITLKSPRNNVQ